MQSIGFPWQMRTFGNFRLRRRRRRRGRRRFGESHQRFQLPLSSSSLVAVVVVAVVVVLLTLIFPSSSSLFLLSQSQQIQAGTTRALSLDARVSSVQLDQPSHNQLCRKYTGTQFLSPNSCRETKQVKKVTHHHNVTARHCPVLACLAFLVKMCK